LEKSRFARTTPVVPTVEPPTVSAATAEALASFVRQRRKANHMTQRHLAELATTKLKISKDDAFGLLLATCGDCIGAVEIVDATGGAR